jgi:hypothetical protein
MSEHDHALRSWWISESGGELVPVHLDRQLFVHQPGRSGFDPDGDLMPTGGAVRRRGRWLLDLDLTVTVDGPRLNSMFALLGIPFPDPLPPSVGTRHGTESGPLPCTAVDAYFDGLDATMLCPSRPGDGDPAGSGVLARARNLDPS